MPEKGYPHPMPLPPPVSTVKGRWTRLATALRLPGDITQAAWTEIETAYTETHRRYHTLTHIEAVLHNLDEHRQLFEDPDIAELALVYHDLVYDPARHDNESQSAARLTARLSDHLDGNRLNRACSHIEATRHHNETPDRDTNLILDLDMSILGASWPDYLAYARGVYAEYAPVYGTESYAVGRVKLFLEPTIAKPRIFLTAPFAALEPRTHDNLTREKSLWLAGAFS